MRKLITLAAFAAAVVPTAPALAQQASATAEARGVILQSLTLTRVSDLDFGTVAGNALQAGTVSINANNGARTVGGGVVAMPGAFARARFDGLGENAQTVSLTLNQPSGGVLSSGANTISALLTLDNSGSTTRTTGTTGGFTVYVGGDFGVAANQPNGLYRADFSLTANYQ